MNPSDLKYSIGQLYNVRTRKFEDLWLFTESKLAVESQNLLSQNQYQTGDESEASKMKKFNVDVYLKIGLYMNIISIFGEVAQKTYNSSAHNIISGSSNTVQSTQQDSINVSDILAKDITESSAQVLENTDATHVVVKVFYGASVKGTYNYDDTSGSTSTSIQIDAGAAIGGKFSFLASIEGDVSLSVKTAFSSSTKKENMHLETSGVLPQQIPFTLAEFKDVLDKIASDIKSQPKSQKDSDSAKPSVVPVMYMLMPLKMVLKSNGSNKNKQFSTLTADIDSQLSEINDKIQGLERNFKRLRKMFSTVEVDLSKNTTDTPTNQDDFKQFPNTFAAIKENSASFSEAKLKQEMKVSQQLTEFYAAETDTAKVNDDLKLQMDNMQDLINQKYSQLQSIPDQFTVKANMQTGLVVADDSIQFNQATNNVLLKALSNTELNSNLQVLFLGLMNIENVARNKHYLQTYIDTQKKQAKCGQFESSKQKSDVNHSFFGLSGGKQYIDQSNSKQQSNFVKLEGSKEATNTVSFYDCSEGSQIGIAEDTLALSKIKVEFSKLPCENVFFSLSQNGHYLNTKADLNTKAVSFQLGAEPECFNLTSTFEQYVVDVDEVNLEMLPQWITASIQKKASIMGLARVRGGVMTEQVADLMSDMITKEA